MKKSKVIERAAKILREHFNIPDDHIKSYRRYMSKSKSSFLFRDDINDSLENRSYTTYIAWYRHMKTNYDMDVRALTSPEAKETIKRMYNKMANNYIIERMKMLGTKS